MSTAEGQPVRARAGVPCAHIYLESRYRKLERGLPQTVFWCPECKGHRRRRRSCRHCGGHGKLTRDSVQELIARAVLPAYRARSGKFHGAGREDIDVLMLGSGRPFVFEVVGPRELDVDLDEIRARIHRRHGERLQIDPLEPVSRARVVHWKESRFDKVYGAVVALGAPADGAAFEVMIGRRIEITQRTPQRVAHRRADLERLRQVEVLAARAGVTGSLELRMRCAHGTYVKEWISGDDGRTRPSLPDLIGVPCRCESLDVLEIIG